MVERKLRALHLRADVSTKAPPRGKSVDFGVRVQGRAPTLLDDVFHRMLRLGWARYFGLASVAFVLLHTIFACLFLAQPGSIANARPGSFADAFFFSVETAGTIGYGNMAPATFYAHVLMSIESFVSLLGLAMTTGLTFAKFARPTARVLFTERAVVGMRDGAPFLMFRLANERHNSIVEAQLRVVLLVDHVSQEGERMRVPEIVQLVRDTNPFFRLSWTAMHAIVPGSAFHGDDARKKLVDRNAMILLSVTGFDETIGQTIHARHTYQLDDLVWGARFADVISVDPDGTRVIDYAKFHEIVEDGSTGKPYRAKA